MKNKFDKFIKVLNDFSYDDLLSFNPNFSNNDWKNSEKIISNNQDYSSLFYLIKNNPYKNFDFGIEKLLAEHSDKIKVYSFLGDLYSFGHYKDPNKEKSEYYYKKATNTGNGYAEYRLGLLQYKRLHNKTEAVCWLERAAKNGNINAQYKLYEIYSNRQDGFYSYFKAIHYLNKAEKQNHIKAAYELGEIYLNELLGQKKDLNKAFFYFKKAADLNNPNAIYQIALSYYLGRELKRDSNKAMELLNKSIAVAYEENFKNLSNVHYLKGKIFHNNKKFLEALRSFYLSAKKGNVKAEYMIGNYFYKKLGVHFDREEALFWYKKSAAGGEKKALIKLFRLKNSILNLKNILKNFEKEKFFQNLSSRKKSKILLLIGFYDKKIKKMIWGYSDLNKKVILSPKLEEQNLIDCFRTDDFIPFFNNGKVGVLNKKGKIVIKNKYDFIGSYSDETFCVRLGKTYTYLDKKGDKIIDFLYEKAEDFKNGLAKVKKDGKYGYINKKGEFIIKNLYYQIEEISNDKYLVKTDTGENYINSLGEFLLKSSYDELGAESEGLIRAKKDNYWGFIDKQGELKINFMYDFVSNFFEGHSKVLLNQKWGTINKNGNFSIKPYYDKLYSISEKYSVGIKNEKIEIIGKCFLDEDIKHIEAFHNEFARVRIGDKYNFLNKNFKKISDINFDDTRLFEKGFAGVSLGGKWGFLNKSGQLVISPKFDDVRDFNEIGLAMVKYKNAIAYIGTNSKFFYRTDLDYFKDVKKINKNFKIDTNFIEKLYYEKDSELKKLLKKFHILDIAIFLKTISHKKNNLYLYNKIINNCNKKQNKKIKDLISEIGDLEFYHYSRSVGKYFKETYEQFKNKSF